MHMRKKLTYLALFMHILILLPQTIDRTVDLSAPKTAYNTLILCVSPIKKSDFFRFLLLQRFRDHVLKYSALEICPL